MDGFPRNAWRAARVSLPATVALLGVLMLQERSESPSSRAAAELPDPARNDVPAYDAARDEARVVRDHRFLLALPSGWSPVAPPPGAEFAAQDEDATASVSLRVMHDPELSFASFVERAHRAFREGLGGSRVVQRSGAGRAQDFVRFTAAPAPGLPDHESLLVARGPFRYQLTTTTIDGTPPSTKRQVRLIANSFTPEAPR